MFLQYVLHRHCAPLTAALLALLFAGEARAVDPKHAQSWIATISTTSQLLKDGSYERALPLLNKVTKEMLDVLAPTHDSRLVLLVPLIQTAIAEAGMGDRPAALWHWHMAQTLDPAAGHSDLSMFGEPGQFLKQNILADPNASNCPSKPLPKNVSPPKIEKIVEPSYPEGSRLSRASGLVILAVKIGTDGTTSEPRLVKSLQAPFDYAAMEALRGWRFSPALEDGKPVETTFCVTLRYRLR